MTTPPDLSAWIDAQLSDSPELDDATADRLSRLLFGGTGTHRSRRHRRTRKATEGMMNGESEHGVTHQHRLPRTRGWGSSSEEPGGSVYCGRCKYSVPVTDEWIRANIRGQERYGLPDIKVVVSSGLTYRWPFAAAPEVGATVLLPGTEWRAAHLDVITRIGSDYDGYLRDIIEWKATA